MYYVIYKEYGEENAIKGIFTTKEQAEQARRQLAQESCINHSGFTLQEVFEESIEAARDIGVELTKKDLSFETFVADWEKGWHIQEIKELNLIV